MLNSRCTRIKNYAKKLGLLLLPLLSLIASLSQADVTSADQVSFQPDPVNAPVVFISSSCAICALNQPMTIGFSADQNGMITVLLIAPDGQQTTLLSQPVEANTLQYVNAVATAPIGKHALITLFGEKQGDLAKTLAQLLPEQVNLATGVSTDKSSEQKGLTLVQEPIQMIPHAIREFEIVE